MQRTELELKYLLQADCQAFVEEVRDLPEDEFRKHMPGKWSVADVMQHLYLSARPVARLMTGPKEMLDQWGKAGSPSRSYEFIASAYQQKLATGVKAPAVVSPRPEDMKTSKGELISRFSQVYQTLAESLANWSEVELDAYQLPHPVLGLLTVREMLYFTSIHTHHHLERLPLIRKG